VSQWRTEEKYDGVGDTLIDDCSTAQGDAIRWAVVDAFFLAGGARDAFSGNGLLPGGARFFDRVFRDQQGPFSRTYVQGVEGTVLYTSSLPQQSQLKMY
jgi:hypothetical protein